MCLLSSVNLQLTSITAPHTICLPIHCTGKLEVAEAMYREVLASKQRVLGLDHPSTLDSTNNLAICLKKQGELQSSRTWLIPMLFIKSAQILRVGQNHIYMVYIRYFWQRNHHIYGHVRCIYTVLANPTNTREIKGMKRDVLFKLCQLVAYKQYSATHSLPTNLLHRQAWGLWSPVSRGTGI